MATKITLSTGNRYLDEDVRRLYALATQTQADIAALKAPSAVPSTPTQVIVNSSGPLPANTVTPVGPTAIPGALLSYAREDHAHDGLHSIAATAQPEIKGDATLSAGAGITLTQAANNIQIAATPAAHRYTGTVVLGAPSATFTVTHSLAVATPFLVYIGIYSSAGVQVTTAGATFVFTTNGLTITFLAPLAADTYSVLCLA